MPSYFVLTLPHRTAIGRSINLSDYRATVGLSAHSRLCFPAMGKMWKAESKMWNRKCGMTLIGPMEATNHVCDVTAVIPQTIRENTNFICLFPQDLKNVNHIYNDHVSSDMSKEEFRTLCKTAWEKPYGFTIIDLSRKKEGGKYRAGLDTFYTPN